MALKTLVLRKKIDDKKKELEQMRKKDPEFETREADLEKSIEEAATEEEKKAVEDAVEEFENDKKEHEEKKHALEEELSSLEADLAKEEEKKPEAPKPDERKDGRNMNTRTKFYGMSVMERDAFFAREEVKKFLTEVRTCIREKRAINNVGLTIPEVMLDLLKQKVQETSKLIGRVTNRPVPGTARQTIMGEIPEAIWTEMCAKLNELSLGFNDVEVDGYKVGGFFAVCNAIADDNDVNLISVILDALGKAIGKAVDKAILYGKGTKMPLGVVTRLAQIEKPSGYLDTAREWKNLSSTHIITGTGAKDVALFKEIVKNAGVAENDYYDGGLTWIMNKNTHMNLMAQSMDKNMNAAIVAGINNTMPVVGGDIIELPFIPDGNIVFGYFEAYLLAERAGTTLGQSEHVRFIEDQTVFKGTARYDGLPLVAEAFGVMSITTEAPTTTVTFPTDTANAS